MYIYTMQSYDNMRNNKEINLSLCRPAIMNHIKDPLLRGFAWDLCRTWKDLGRKVGVSP